jgi:hypothetical protein
MQRSYNLSKIELNKSRFVMGRQCPKALYLATHAPDTQATLTALERKTLAWGNTVGEAARCTIPNGVQINSLDINEALRKTQQAIATGVLTLYEPAFLYDNILVRVDILSRDTTESPWDFYEIKATTYHDCDKWQKAEYRNDIGIQVWVLQQLSIPLGRISLMHLNRECRYPDLKDLFSFEDYSTEIIPVLADIKSDIAALKKTLTQKVEPSVSIGNQCDKPRICPFKVHCWGHIPELSIFNIPRNLKKWEQYEQGTISICSLNMSDFKSETQQRALLCYKDQNPYFDPEIVAELLNEWKYPLSYLDFEAIDYAIPRFPGARPYQHIPFQFSCHIQRSPDTELEHAEFLWTTKDDPRPAFIQKLLDSVPAAGSVIIYSASYESTRLKELAEDFPEYEVQLTNIRDRLVDLKVVIQKGVFYPEFMGSFSIKKVAPALLGEVASYANLTVSDGVEAMLAFDRMVSLTDTSNEKQVLRSDLLKYCQQDTLLMTELYRTLRDKIHSIEDKKWIVQTQKKEIEIPVIHFQNT